ncbi:POU domain, class 5, transcription factor 1.1-like [Spea bombifrons]|uniref:POU domain, class 5, transcription factor 1.1-like n=1 Tax=Spea bombifrons TaxID=233779 RepID=UPI00234A5F19|nr:POU domain, class 5, transcription factor 1.1-like [Spea bombifrons]
MYGQQAYPAFSFNHGLLQEGFGGYPPYPQQYYHFSAGKLDNVDLGGQPNGEGTAQVMSWNPLAQFEFHNHMNSYEQPPQPREQSPAKVEAKSIKEESDYDSESKEESVAEKFSPAPNLPEPQFSNSWTSPYWPGASTTTASNSSPPLPSQHLPKPPSAQDSTTYPTGANHSPQTPAECEVTSLESSRCGSANVTSRGTEEAYDGKGSFTQYIIRTYGNMSDVEEETPTEVEMEQFAKELKHKRVSLGYTQADVGYMLGIIFDKLFSQTTICRFESLQLSYKNMCQLKPLLSHWLVVAEKYDNLLELLTKEQSLIHTRKRKRRTNIEAVVKAHLEKYYMKCPKPSAQEMSQMAKDLKIGKEVVRIWFCNRRQKEKREGDAHSAANPKEAYEVGVQPLLPHSPYGLPQGMASQGYLAAPLSSSPGIYASAFHKNDSFHQSIGHMVPMGNQLC